MHQSILGTVCIEIIDHLVKSNHGIGPNKGTFSWAFIIGTYPRAILTNTFVTLYRNTIAFTRFSILPPPDGAAERTLEMKTVLSRTSYFDECTDILFSRYIFRHSRRDHRDRHKLENSPRYNMNPKYLEQVTGM